jgi:hypothetical protein
VTLISLLSDFIMDAITGKLDVLEHTSNSRITKTYALCDAADQRAVRLHAAAAAASVHAAAAADASKQLKVPMPFLTTIVVPIVGNAAEHASALIFAVKNRMEISLGVAIGTLATLRTYKHACCQSAANAFLYV